MAVPSKWALAWLAATGFMALVLTVSDKRRAKKGVWRIPERTLWLVAVLGGAPVMYVAMQLCRHKTKHRRFMWGLPLLILAQLGSLLWLWQENWIIFI